MLKVKLAEFVDNKEMLKDEATKKLTTKYKDYMVILVKKGE